MITIKLTQAQHEVVMIVLRDILTAPKGNQYNEATGGGVTLTQRDYNTFQRACKKIWNPEEDKLKKIKKILRAVI